MISETATKPPTRSLTSESGAQNSRARSARSSLTIVEAVVSIAIVGVMLVAALNAVGGSRQTQKIMNERARAMLLAEDLMAEIMKQYYEDDDLEPGSFGLSASKVGDGSRALFTDVDDYNGWVGAPPEDKVGAVISGFADWSRSVDVDWVNPEDAYDLKHSDTGAKIITVKVAHNQTVLAQLSAVRTRASSYGPETP